ncbi:peptidyl-tRNA hydrolase ICT1, mitochondrial-like [Xenia sp. Carnegie-2017]|uniref:peptidyl-tRNA hydrolase ICT1, mitochondrial-like n=1 Tax=Xenia sp. Carnegie-2017 TaxID=2897299 RepID=UPI001F049C3D|nr:peptidyl-tRNA hydrolase ICT1, mitochondrial-like [Xenia sp. Carnegie-2017]
MLRRFGSGCFSRVFSSFSSYRIPVVCLFHNGNSATTEEKKEQFKGPIPIENLTIKYSRSPGPGGQNVNKVNTKVDIRFHVMTADWIPLWIRKKLFIEEGSRINKDGEMVLQSSRFRDQKKNLNDVIARIERILQNVSAVPKETSEEKKNKINNMIRSQDERRLKEKKFRSQRKSERSGQQL